MIANDYITTIGIVLFIESLNFALKLHQIAIFTFKICKLFSRFNKKILF